jgi:hypothetical protein
MLNTEGDLNILIVEKVFLTYSELEDNFLYNYQREGMKCKILEAREVKQ